MVRAAGRENESLHAFRIEQQCCCIKKAVTRACTPELIMWPYCEYQPTCAWTRETLKTCPKILVGCPFFRLEPSWGVCARLPAAFFFFLTWCVCVLQWCVWRRESAESVVEGLTVTLSGRQKQCNPTGAALLRKRAGVCVCVSWGSCVLSALV